MIITYHGQTHVKIALGDMTIAYNPVSKDSNKKVTKYGANIALSSLNLPSYNGTHQMSHGSKEPFTVIGPGEYETSGVFIKGIGVETQIGANMYINTVYTFVLDNMKVCLLGCLSKKLSAEAREQLDNVDVLFVCGLEDGSGLTPFELYTEAQKLSPKIIIPLGFNQTDFALFLREGGKDTKEQLDKLTIKRKDIEMKNGEVVVLSEV